MHKWSVSWKIGVVQEFKPRLHSSKSGKQEQRERHQLHHKRAFGKPESIARRKTRLSEGRKHTPNIFEEKKKKKKER
jgi:hypothetical protein